MDRLFLGFDTSAYTTSIAAVDENNNVVFDLRKMLIVKKGARGLRQQEAVFQHVNNLPLLIEKASRIIDIKSITSITASTKPRNVDGSYMPVFKVGEGHASALASALGVEYNTTSHQDGHIGSIYIDDIIKDKELGNFLALHISGGTTELLKVKNYETYDIEIIGGTKDISAGQLIDRIGVKMGLRFPSGKEIDKLSQSGEVLKGSPVSTNKTWLNFSGTETYFERIMEKGNVSKDTIAKSLLHSIAYSLKKIILTALEENNLSNIVITGGVSANSYIREVLHSISEEECQSNIIFPNIKYSTDNAVGVAYIGSKVWRHRNGTESVKGK